MFSPEHAGTPAAPTILRGHGAAIISGAAPIRATAIPANKICRSDPRLLAVDVSPHGQPGLGEFGFHRPIAQAPPFILAESGCLPSARLPERGWFVADPECLQIDGAMLSLALADDTLPDIEGETALWIEFLYQADWDWHIARVRSVDNQTRRLRFDRPHPGVPLRDFQFSFAFRNLRSALARPASSWLDPVNRQIVFHPPSGDLALCSMAGHLVRLHDTRHVVIEDIHFRGGLANAIHASGCADISVVRCRAEDFAAGGFHFEGSRTRVKHSHFLNIGTTALRIEAGEPATLTAGGSLVEGCTFARWGARKPIYEPAVRLMGVGTTVRNCTFRDAPHLAIEVSGNDHLIEGCTFERVVTDIDDMGAIYANIGEDPLQRGHLIRHNLFRDIGRGRAIASAVYLDRASAGISVRENVFHRINGQDKALIRAVHVNGGRDIEIARNLFVDCDCSIELCFYLASWGVIELPVMEAGLARVRSELAAAPHLQRYPELAEMAAQSLALPASNRFNHNVSVLQSRDARAIVISDGDPDLVEQHGNVAIAPARGTLMLSPPWDLLFGALTSADLGLEIDRLFVDWSASLIAGRLQRSD